MRVLLVSPWGTACGIAEHSFYLKQAVKAADPTLRITVSSSGLDPDACPPGPFDLVHLNYQAALHSRWTPDAIMGVQATGAKVVVTYHDTGVPNSEQCKTICWAANAAVVHEPCADLPARTRYWRMGVPGVSLFRSASKGLRERTPARRVLGTLGFPFPWKHYDELAKVTAAAGWGLVLLAPTATKDQVARWRQRNKWVKPITTFTPRDTALALLAGCDATAFTYVCHNTGQSGAILQGIAARRPVFALSTCRQFRALYADPLARTAITWIETFEQLEAGLQAFSSDSVPLITELARQDSWRTLGQRYAQLYREVVGG